jgi:hypothetical protein
VVAFINLLDKPSFVRAQISRIILQRRSIGSDMNIPRDHHFIPAFYLKQWTDQSGKLIEYTRKHDKLISKPVGPRKTGYETDLYTFSELPPEAAQYLEQKFFEYADRTASLALDNHLGIRALPWTSELISAWSRFVIAINIRHPDAMPELRAKVQQIWNVRGVTAQKLYDKIKKPEEPAIVDEYLAARDPLIAVKMRVNMIVAALDNDIVLTQVNRMKWAVIDLSASPERLLTSDRPLQYYRLGHPDGVASLPISPIKLFVAVNDEAVLVDLRKAKPRDIARRLNKFIASRARRFVWSRDKSQERFIENNMSTRLEPTPLLPFGR